MSRTRLERVRAAVGIASLDDDEDIVCTIHGPNNDDNQDDPEGHDSLDTEAISA
ncbi:hypothetical protein [Streptomyces diastaticus]|uniref:hypothetical protein n=1 Tax=Streptomyces diastaticus TaxID=1956 RepID=UPI0034502D7D